MIEYDCPQNSTEWFAARLGIPTASKFATVMAKGKDGGASVTRRSYIFKLAGEIITEQPKVDYQNADMLRGQEQEPEARNVYRLVTRHDVRLVGFVREGQAGCSPDGLIGEEGGVEFKCDLPHVQAERLYRDELPSEYRAQVQGCMWITGRQWWDFVSYCPRMSLFIKRVPRDDDYIANLAGAVSKFNDELKETVEKIRSYGEPKPSTMDQLKASVRKTGFDPDILMAG